MECHQCGKNEDMVEHTHEVCLAMEEGHYHLVTIVGNDISLLARKSYGRWRLSPPSPLSATLEQGAQ